MTGEDHLVVEWFDQGHRHPLDGKLMAANDDFYMLEWWQHDQLHREGGPAEHWWNGKQTWRQRGLCHRLDGPADFSSDSLHRRWFVRGSQVPGDHQHVLDDLAESGQIELLRLVLSAWHPDAASPAELLGAIRAAHA